jgi:hypothetical protein
MTYAVEPDPPQAAAPHPAEEPPAPGNGGRILRAVAWPVSLLLAAILLTSVGLVLVVAFGGSTDIARLIGEAHAINRLVALILIVPSIVLLAETSKVEGAAAIAALSGIAGYVLGGTSGGP